MEFTVAAKSSTNAEYAVDQMLVLVVMASPTVEKCQMHAVYVVARAIPVRDVATSAR